MGCDSTTCTSRKSKKICPLAFGLALGLACALTIIVCGAWAMYYGMSPEMTASMTAHGMTLPLDWSMVLMRALWWFLKGLIFGFVLAFLYDAISCCCRCKCCRCNDPNCNCNCKTNTKVKM